MSGVTRTVGGGVAAVVLAGALQLTGCGRSQPAQQEAAPAAPSAPAETRAAVVPAPAPASPSSALAPSDAPPPHVDRRERREQRRLERLERALAAGPIAIAEAQRDKAHGRLVEFDATVEKLLRPDRKGLPHERIVVRVAGAGTVLIAHNTKLGGEVPVEVGDQIRVRGVFEWNARGGVVHWTHHDPAGGKGGGFIRAGGKTYQ